MLEKLRQIPDGDLGLAGEQPEDEPPAKPAESESALPKPDKSPAKEEAKPPAVPDLAETVPVTAYPMPAPSTSERIDDADKTRLRDSEAPTADMPQPRPEPHSEPRPEPQLQPQPQPPAIKVRPRDVPTQPARPQVQAAPAAPPHPARPRRGLSLVFVVAIIATVAALTTLYAMAPHHATPQADEAAATRTLASHTTASNTAARNTAASKPKPAAGPSSAAPGARQTESSQPRAGRSASGKAIERPATKAAAVVPHALNATPVSVHVTFEAESFSANHGTQISFPTHASGGQTVGHTSAGDWVGYASRSLSGVHSVVLRTTAGKGGASVQIRANSATGPLLGTAFLPATPDFDTFESVTTRLTASSSGPLFIDFLGPTAADIDTVTLSS
jgi:hypothetical protein